jgi:hypothetical protein
MNYKESCLPDRELAAVCGLFCPGCWIFIASRETAEKRERLASTMGRPVDTLHCDGCRAEKRYSYCETCTLVVCATARGLDFCGVCAEYPCEDLKQFQAARPHRLELWQSQARIQEVGWEQWFEEMVAYYACGQCGTFNSAYHLSCRACGAEPSNGYVAAHQAEIVAYLRNRAG